MVQACVLWRLEQEVLSRVALNSGAANAFASADRGAILGVLSTWYLEEYVVFQRKHTIQGALRIDSMSESISFDQLRET